MRANNTLPAILGGKTAFKSMVPITVPTIPSIDSLAEKYKKILKSGMITNAKYVREFESAVEKYIGVKHAVAVSSCTSGLILGMKVLGLKGEVILPSFTFHATAHAAVWNNLKLNFVDCDKETYTLDPEKVEAAITPKTSAIIAVHLFGNPADVEALQKIAKKYKLALVFDAAHGFGAQYKSQPVGIFGDFESFSLSPTKLVTAGEGGIVTTNNDKLAELLRIARNYGDCGNYDCEFSGFNARMNEFSGLLGGESLKKLERNVTKRNKMVSLYKKLLERLPGISFQKIQKGNRSSYKDFSIVIDKKLFGLSRDTLAQCLQKENICVKKYFYPLVHTQKAFSKFIGHTYPLFHSQAIAENTLSLPLYSHISSATVRGICDAITSIYNHREKISRNL